MALRDITNIVAFYIPQIKLHPRYAPLIRRGTNLDEQASRSSFPARRAGGETHIDLWVDGNLYPTDPATNSAPAFRTIKEYIEFLCNGERGMLGYIKRLSAGTADSAVGDGYRKRAACLEETVVRLQSKVIAYEHDIQQWRLLANEFQNQARSMSDATARHNEERLQLQNDVRVLETVCCDLRALVAHSDVRAAEAAQYQGRVEALEAELESCRDTCRKLEDKMSSMVQIPFGFRRRVHAGKMKNLDELVKGSGHAKRRRTLLRAQIQPSTVSQLQGINKRHGFKRRLGGVGDSQSKTAAVLASFLSAGEALKLVEQPRMTQATTVVAQCMFKKIQRAIGEDLMLSVCDGDGVTHKGYEAMCKAVKHRVQLVAPQFKGSLLPSGHRLAQLRKQMNAKLPQFIGDWYHIEGRRIILEVRVGKKIVHAQKEVILDEKNNLFAELEVVQRSMILFYDITLEGNNLFS